MKPLVKPDHLLISIAAGVSLAALEAMVPQGRFVRGNAEYTGANSACVAAYALGKNIQPVEAERVAAIFGCVGRVISVPENLMDAITALGGSGPAYVFYFIEALVEAGVLLGLGREQAGILAVETLSGAVEMLKRTGEHPAKLREEVTSPGGTTAAALFELEKAGFPEY